MMRTVHVSPLFSTGRTLFTPLCFFLLLLWIVVAPAGADTNVGGAISTDTTWTVAGSPYSVTSNITIQGADGADSITTLTIETGVIVKLNQYTHIETGSTINSGISLLATGTVDFSGNTINQNNAFPIKAYSDNIGGISASTFANLDADSYMGIKGGTVSRDATWSAAMPYAITSNITVQGADGADGITTLTILPGATLKSNSNA